MAKSIFKKHFAVTITAAVSFSAVLISAAQVWIASIDKEKEIELASFNAREKQKHEEIKSDREWKLDLAKFMANHREEIFSEDKEGKKIQQIMLATFPPEITSSVFGSLSKISNQNTYWTDAAYHADTLSFPRVKIYYDSFFPSTILEIIGDTIAGGDIEYNYYDQLIPEGLTSGDIRYFHKDDLAIAQQVQEDFINQSCVEGFELKLELIPLINSNLRAPKGTVELWLSGKHIKKVSSNDKEC